MGRNKADFELTYFADGHAELVNRAGDLVWSSDDDDDFVEEFGEEFLSDEEDSEDILAYLEEQNHIDLERDEVDIIENDLEDEAADDDEFDDVIEGEFKDLEPREKMRRKPRLQ